MFYGTIPNDVRRIMKGIVRDWRCSDVYVGCSGNFTVERVLSETGRFRLHSNDVTIYSTAVGRYYTGKPLGIRVRDDVAPEFDWLHKYGETDLDVLASLMLFTNLSTAYDAKGEVKQNAYYQRLIKGFRDQWPELHDRTRERITSLDLQLASFHCGDVVDWVRTIPPDAGFSAYPPFFSGGYENMWEHLAFAFDWEPPDYPVMDDERKAQLLTEVRARGRQWILGVQWQIKGWEEHLVGLAFATNHGVPLYIYSDDGAKRAVVPHKDSEPVPAPRLSPGQEIGDTMTLARLTPGQFRALRSQYMNKGIRPGEPSIAYGVLVDGYLVGCFALSGASNHTDYLRPAHAYLMSDFAVRPTDYPRLSKLVLYAVLSRESQILAERLLNRRVREFNTTAFSERPISMKYRGLFEVHKRSEVRKGTDVLPYAQQRYKIEYYARAGQWTLNEGLGEWKRQYGSHSK